MILASWNVNSLRIRLAQVLDWLAAHKPDVLCLQETKLTDDDFPAEAVRAAGYQAIYSGQKTYNGVALLTREAPGEAITDLPGAQDPQRRFIAATVGGVRVVNVYVPNGSEVGSDKYAYKLHWLGYLSEFLRSELDRHHLLAVAGDFNIAPEDRDVHDPVAWEGSVLVSQRERDALRAVMGHGLHDTFRKFEEGDGHYTWWDYRAAAFRRNRGLRIDHILASDALYERCRACAIDKSARRQERPSDHAPIAARFDD